MTSQQPAELRGRASECAVLDALVGRLQQGERQLLVLRGEAGEAGETATSGESRVFTRASASGVSVGRHGSGLGAFQIVAWAARAGATDGAE